MTRSREAAFLVVRALLFATALVLLMRAAGARGDRRNLTPDQLGLAMGRHYNRVKLPMGNSEGRQLRQKAEVEPLSTKRRLAKEYGVDASTIERAGKFAAAVETLKAIDPEIRDHAHPDEWRPTPPPRGTFTIPLDTVSGERLR